LIVFAFYEEGRLAGAAFFFGKPWGHIVKTDRHSRIRLVLMGKPKAFSPHPDIESFTTSCPHDGQR
jgi:hypothetical protein